MYVCLNSVYVSACVHDCVYVRERVNVVISLLLMGK